MLPEALTHWSMIVAVVSTLIAWGSLLWRSVTIPQHDGVRIVTIVEVAALVLTTVATSLALWSYMYGSAQSTWTGLAVAGVVAVVGVALSWWALTAVRAVRLRRAK